MRTGTTIEQKVKHATNIIMGLGLHINGVTTCGDYMFSGTFGWMDGWMIGIVVLVWVVFVTGCDQVEVATV